MSLVLRGMRTNARFVLTVQTKGEIMNAKCHTCEWESLNYTHKHWAEKAADKHQAVYHQNQSNIISIQEGK